MKAYLVLKESRIHRGAAYSTAGMAQNLVQSVRTRGLINIRTCGGPAGNGNGTKITAATTAPSTPHEGRSMD